MRAIFTQSVLAVLAGSIAVAGCGSSSPACDLDALLRRRAGTGAVDCGHVAIGASTAASDQCIADQGAAGTPFFARYDVQGIDSQVALGVVRDPQGQTSVLLWDSDPSGGSGAPARITESVCGGDPPVQTPLTRPDGFPVVSCTVEVSTDLACSG
jgi:hypothetical protein